MNQRLVFTKFGLFLCLFVVTVALSANVEGTPSFFDEGGLEYLGGDDSFSPSLIKLATPIKRVCTPEDLDDIRNDLDGRYLQVCDIDLSGYDFEPIGTFIYDYSNNWWIRSWQSYYGIIFRQSSKDL